MPASQNAVSQKSVTDNARALDALVTEIRACRLCDLPHEPNPVVWVHPDARILIAGQAPGRRVHESGIPWDDPSGDRLRDWMGLDRARFYDRNNIAVAAMGFCYPGTVKGADLPPKRACAPRWRPLLLPLLKKVQLTLLVGAYAHRYHLGASAGRSLTETVCNWRAHPPKTIVLPHPSWRNSAWLKRNPWFEAEVVPDLRARVADVLR